jgi:hypothetical protein
MKFNVESFRKARDGSLIDERLPTPIMMMEV